MLSMEPEAEGVRVAEICGVEGLIGVGDRGPSALSDSDAAGPMGVVAAEGLAEAVGGLMVGADDPDPGIDRGPRPDLRGARSV